MEADEFEVRKQELISECTVPPQVFERVMPRLERFMAPFVERLFRKEQVEHANMFVQGLLSSLDRKNAESIAYLFGQERMPLQHFLGISEWDDKPLREELARLIGQQLGEAGGVIVFDPSAFPKSGNNSVGVKRQWCGRLGKIENCQVGVYIGYASSREHALVDMRLYLPLEWAKDWKRRKQAGIPKEIRYRTRHELCLEMLAEHGEQLPHQWITGDDEMGRPYWFRRHLDLLGEQYLLAVPCNTTVRDLEVDPPAYSGRGRYPKRPWIRVDRLTATLEEEDWIKIDVRDGSKGPIIIEAVKRRVMSRTDKRQEGHEETFVAIRYRDREDQRVVKMDYYLSNANHDTQLAEFGRAAKAEHRIEECIQRAKGEAGLADYEVRTWRGWHHHQTLSLIATWFLVTETRRGKKMDTGNHASADPGGHRVDPPQPLRMRYSLCNPGHPRKASPTQPARLPIPLETS